MWLVAARPSYILLSSRPIVILACLGASPTNPGETHQECAVVGYQIRSFAVFWPVIKPLWLEAGVNDVKDKGAR